jgi:hypothetical protein
MSFKPHPSCCLWERGGICVELWVHAEQICVYFHKWKDIVCVFGTWNGKSSWLLLKLCSNPGISVICKHWTNWELGTENTYVRDIQLHWVWGAVWGLANCVIVVSVLHLILLIGKGLMCCVSNLQTNEPGRNNIFLNMLFQYIIYEWACVSLKLKALPYFSWSYSHWQLMTLSFIQGQSSTLIPQKTQKL